MKFLICAVTTLISVQSFAVGTFSQKQDAKSDPNEVTELYAAVFSAPNSTAAKTLKISYLTSGCTEGKPSYKLEILEQRPEFDPADPSQVVLVELKVKLHIIDGTTGTCRMLINIDDEINLDQLLKDNLVALGLGKYNTKKTLIGARFVIPPVMGQGGVDEID